MPIREGKAKLWFNTKEEQDEFDDKMIANIRLQSPNYEDPNYTAAFIRKRQQMHLQLTDQAKSQLSRIRFKNYTQYADKYAPGKRDHTFWREWTIQKFGFTYALTYLLIRELPIRNFYARAWVMFYFFGKTAEVWWKGFSVVPDEFTDKAIRNYGAYQTFYHNTPPTLDGKLPEEALWKMNQPGFLRYTPERYAGSVFQAVVLDPAPKIIDWDGTFNMPLNGLANPKHKDSKNIDFIYE